MYKSLASIAFLVALLGGCTSTLPPSNFPGPDPSNPSAPEASAPRARESLVATTHVYLEPSVGQEAQTMDHSNMQGMDHSKMSGMEMQKTSDEVKKSTAVIYTCPMHPQIKEAKPGNCSICGMTLIEKPAKSEGTRP